MHDKAARFRFLALLVTLAGGPAFAALPETLIGKGDLRSLSVLPDRVALRGAGQVQQLLVTGHFANGGVADLTTQAAWRVGDPRVVRVEPGGLLVAQNNGSTEVTFEV